MLWQLRNELSDWPNVSRWLLQLLKTTEVVSPKQFEYILTILTASDQCDEQGLAALALRYLQEHRRRRRSGCVRSPRSSALIFRKGSVT